MPYIHCGNVFIWTTLVEDKLSTHDVEKIIKISQKVKVALQKHIRENDQQISLKSLLTP